MGSADCVATRLLARRFCEPRRALRTSRRETRFTKLPPEVARRALRRPRPPMNPQGLREGSRESQAPAQTHANGKLLATQSGDPFCFDLEDLEMIWRTLSHQARLKCLPPASSRPGTALQSRGLHPCLRTESTKRSGRSIGRRTLWGSPKSP